MKIRQQEYLRFFLCCGYIASRVITNNSDTELIRELNEYLMTNNIDINNIEDLFTLGYEFSFLSAFRFEKITTDYKEIQSLYRQVISNIGELIEYLGIQNDSIKVFALFVYLYRNGYLSYNHKFMYSTKMKDLADLGGVDVVRGTGVCRSISSMFTDVCNQVGLTSTNLAVKVDAKSLALKENLSETALEVEKTGAKFAKIVGKITKFLPVGNHLVSLVHNNDSAAVFDPTNDVYMKMTNFHKYTFINNTGAKMTYNFISNISTFILGNTKVNLNIKRLMNISRHNVTSNDEYSIKYRETLQLIKDNKELFEQFYELNNYLYNEIYNKASNQHGMVKRLMPIIPSIKKR